MTRLQTYITMGFLILVIILTSMYLYQLVTHEFGLGQDQVATQEPVQVTPEPQTTVVIIPSPAQDEPASTAPDTPGDVLGATRQEVNAVLSGWRSERNDANPNWQNYFDDAQKGLKMTVMFSSTGHATVVSVVDQQDRGLSREQIQELLDLIGGTGVELEVHTNIGSFARVEVPDQDRLPEINGQIIGFTVGATD